MEGFPNPMRSDAVAPPSLGGSMPEAPSLRDLCLNVLRSGSHPNLAPDDAIQSIQNSFHLVVDFCFVDLRVTRVEEISIAGKRACAKPEDTIVRATKSTRPSSM